MHYSLRHRDTGNLIGEFDSQGDALRAVRSQIRAMANPLILQAGLDEMVESSVSGEELFEAAFPSRTPYDWVKRSETFTAPDIDEGWGYHSCLTQLTDALSRRFGLPPGDAQGYAREVLKKGVDRRSLDPRSINRSLQRLLTSLQ